MFGRLSKWSESKVWNDKIYNFVTNFMKRIIYYHPRTYSYHPQISPYYTHLFKYMYIYLYIYFFGLGQTNMMGGRGHWRKEPPWTKQVKWQNCISFSPSLFSWAQAPGWFSQHWCCPRGKTDPENLVSLLWTCILVVQWVCGERLSPDS